MGPPVYGGGGSEERLNSASLVDDTAPQHSLRALSVTATPCSALGICFLATCEFRQTHQPVLKCLVCVCVYVGFECVG